MFYSTEDGSLVTLGMLYTEWLTQATDETFAEYVADCTDRNGTLRCLATDGNIQGFIMANGSLRSFYDTYRYYIRSGVATSYLGWLADNVERFASVIVDADEYRQAAEWLY